MKNSVPSFLQSKFVKNFISHFLEGLVLIAPIVITGFVFYRLFIFFSTTFLFPHIVNPYLDPVIIIAGTVLFIYIIGLLSASIIFTPVIMRLEKDVEKVPLFRVVYSAVKDLFSAFVGNKKKFNQPVLVTIDKINEIKQIGFVTQTDLTAMSIEKDLIAVYLPFSYGLSGKVIIIHKDRIQNLDVTAAEAMKFVISGGVTNVD